MFFAATIGFKTELTWFSNIKWISNVRKYFISLYPQYKKNWFIIYNHYHKIIKN